jgi:hypothetical protein
VTNGTLGGGVGRTGREGDRSDHGPDVGFPGHDLEKQGVEMVPPVANAIHERTSGPPQAGSADPSVPSVWSVVSAYLHTGVAAEDARPAPAHRAAACDRVTQVRVLFDRTHVAAEPRVARGSAREALRTLFAQTDEPRAARRGDPLEGGGAAAGADEAAVVDLRDDDVVIDLRDGAGHQAPVSGRGRVARHAGAVPAGDGAVPAALDTSRADPVGAALVNWYANRQLLAGVAGSRLHGHPGR